MAPANTTVNHVRTGTTGDSLSVTLMDHIKIDFAVRIKANERLSSMVPDKSLPGMLKSMDRNQRDTVYPIVNNVDDESNDDDNMYTVHRIGNRQTPRSE